MFYSYFAALGFDMVVELLPEGQALQQLKDKAYADKYRTVVRFEVADA